MYENLPVLIICGTRPEAIKLAPVVNALRQRNFRVILVATGQHPALGKQLLDETGLMLDVDLRVHQPGNTPAQLMAAILAQLPQVIAAYKPVLTLVQGDTVSALAGALASYYARVPVGHVEAGLRTYDQGEPFPEEMHRCAITSLATLHFAPTPQAIGALEREGVDPDMIHHTGNTGIDALLDVVRRMDQDPENARVMAERFPFVENARVPLLLATVHRRENIGIRLAAIAAGLARLASFREVKVVLPLHPNPQVANQLRKHLGGLQGVHLLPAVDHAAMVWLMRHARLLLTDSGGLQEEAPALGLRTLILRTVTERQEAVAAGVSELVPLSADAIYQAVCVALDQPPLQPVFPFGRGDAATRIADAIGNWLSPRQPRIVPAMLAGSLTAAPEVQAVKE